MNAFSEKKWFVYLRDHHIGPLALGEIQQKMDLGEVSSDNYVWAEGMADWQVMREVGDFAILLTTKDLKTAMSLPVANRSYDYDLEKVEPVDTESLLHVDPISDDSAEDDFTAVAAASSESPIDPSPSASVDLSAEVSQEISHETLSEKPVALEERELEKVEEIPLALEPLQEEIVPAAENSEAAVEGRSSRTWLGATIFIFIAVVSLSAVTFLGYLDPVLQPLGIRFKTDFVLNAARHQLSPFVEKFPALANWIAPFPKMENINPSEYQELKAVARASLKKSGPRFALAKDQESQTMASFVVSSNLPDGAQFKIFVVGEPETLLNELSFTTAIRTSLIERVAKTMSVRYPDGKNLPRGEYQVYLTLDEQQMPAVATALEHLQPIAVRIPPGLPKTGHVVAFKTYFLGGQKDESYLAGLKEFHEKLQARASSEMNEIKQLTATIDSQFADTQTKFGMLQSLKAKLNINQKKTWTGFHTAWEQTQRKLSDVYRNWTPDILENNYFYGPLYRLVQQSGQAVEKVHALHDAYFKGAKEKDFDGQLSQSIASAQNALSYLKAKVEETEKLPLTANGMPRRVE